MDGDSAEIEFFIAIHAHPEKVYETLTSGTGWDGWLTNGTTMDLQPGGQILFRWDDQDAESTGQVFELDPPRLFSFRWHPDGPDYFTTVSFTLTTTPDGTQLHLSEAGFPETPQGIDAMAIYSTMWGQAMTLLKDYLERQG
jgi:uncharacterized protein YndB with AHSA1/START domain